MSFSKKHVNGNSRRCHRQNSTFHFNAVFMYIITFSENVAHYAFLLRALASKAIANNFY